MIKFIACGICLLGAFFFVRVIFIFKILSWTMATIKEYEDILKEKGIHNEKFEYELKFIKPNFLGVFWSQPWNWNRDICLMDDFKDELFDTIENSA
jgi:hypothetical protein